ncbi:MAG: protein BatD [Verrucomicrobiae bacterium]|nr:protein BatD [Verrucomicrobiae bacterium]
MNNRISSISNLGRTACLLALACLSTTALAIAASSATVNASLEQERIAAGATTTFTITVDGTQSAPRPQTPVVDGLEFYPAGQSSRYQSINGRTSVSIGYQFTVLARREGRFEIPPIAISVDGHTLQTDPVTLIVSKGSALPAPATQPPGLTTRPSARGGSSGDAKNSDIAKLTLTLPDRNSDSAYVGELIPIKLEAWFREGAQVSLTSKPTMDGQAYTLHNISDEPSQEVKTVSGEPYRVITWYGGLSAVKAGKYPVDIRLDATVAVRQQRTRGTSRTLPGFGRLSDPLFDNFFNSAFDDFFAPMVEQDIKLATEERVLEIQPLPGEGKPDNFSGAVGQFAIHSFSLPTTAKTGEPVKIRVSVEGTGNFDRVNCPELDPRDAWKTYQPKSDFVALDSAGFQGRKTFDLNAVPKKPGSTETQFAFSYFDPKTGRYASAASEPVPLTITGSPLTDAIEPNSAGTPPSQADSPATSSSTNIDSKSIAPLKTADTAPVNLTPLYRRPWFVTLHGGLAFITIVALIAGRIRQRRMNPESIAARESQHRLEQALEAVDHARLKADSSAFFLAGRRALQIRAGLVSKRNPETLTGADFASGSIARQVFELADASEYSHVSVDPEQLSHWQTKLDQAIAELQASLESKPFRNPNTNIQ